MVLVIVEFIDAVVIEKEGVNNEILDNMRRTMSALQTIILIFGWSSMVFCDMYVVIHAILISRIRSNV